MRGCRANRSEHWGTAQQYGPHCFALVNFAPRKNTEARRAVPVAAERYALRATAATLRRTARCGAKIIRRRSRMRKSRLAGPGQKQHARPKA
jgi:hypothetical protein